MSSIDLFEEFSAAVDRMTPRHFNALEAAGILSSTLFLGASLVGVASIEPLKGGLYEPTERAAGERYFLTPAGTRGENGIEWEAIYDLVAWRPSQPQAVFLRAGNAVTLNPTATERAEFFCETLPLYASPLSWLKHGGTGDVVLDWSSCLRLRVGRVAKIAAENEVLGRRIQAALRQPPIPIPIVEVIDEEASHAA